MIKDPCTKERGLADHRGHQSRAKREKSVPDEEDCGGGEGGPAGLTHKWLAAGRAGSGCLEGVKEAPHLRACSGLGPTRCARHRRARCSQDGAVWAMLGSWGGG